MLREPSRFRTAELSFGSWHGVGVQGFDDGDNVRGYVGWVDLYFYLYCTDPLF